MEKNEVKKYRGKSPQMWTENKRKRTCIEIWILQKKAFWTLQFHISNRTGWEKTSLKVALFTIFFLETGIKGIFMAP